MRKAFGFTILLLIVLIVGLGLSQLWFHALEWDIFFKTMVTLVVLTMLVGLVWLIREQFIEEDKLKKDGFIDS